MSRQKQLKAILLDKKLRQTTNLCVEIMNSKRQVKGKLGTNLRLPFDVNAMLNLSDEGFKSDTRFPKRNKETELSEEFH